MRSESMWWLNTFVLCLVFGVICICNADRIEKLEKRVPLQPCPCVGCGCQDTWIMPDVLADRPDFDV
jgi:hypothetical protein